MITMRGIGPAVADLLDEMIPSGKAVSIVVLDLGGNKLTELPSSLQQMPRLTTLAANGNQLKTIVLSSQTLSKLQALDVRDNVLEVFPEVGTARALRLLDASKNRIPEIPATLANLTSLEMLRIERSKAR